MPSVIDAAVAGARVGAWSSFWGGRVEVFGSGKRAAEGEGHGRRGVTIEGYRNMKPADLRKRNTDRS